MDYKVRISELSTAARVQPNDLLIISQKNSGSQDFTSKKMSYSSLSTVIYNDLSQSVSTMISAADAYVLLSKAEYLRKKANGEIESTKLYCISDDVEQGGGGGGSTVVVVPTYLSGSNLATIYVDDDASEIKIPNDMFIKSINGLSGDISGDVDITDIINTQINNFIENYDFDTIINKYITENITNIRNIIMGEYMLDPEALLVLDASKYYKSQVHTVNQMGSTLGSMDIINPIEIRQEEYIKLMFNYSAKTKSAANVQRIELQVWDTTGSRWSIVDQIYSTDTNVFHNYKRWLKCNAGSKIKFVAYAATTTTKIAANWNSFDLTTFEYADAEFLSYVTTQITTSYKRIASQVYTVPYDGRLIVNGQTDYWNYGSGAYAYNYYEGNYLYHYDVSTNKRIEIIKIRYIPTLEYAMNGKYKDTHEYYKGGNPATDTSLSNVMMHVLPSDISWNDIGANVKDTTKEYRFSNVKENEIYQQKKAELFISDTELYNFNHRKQYYVSLVKITNFDSSGKPKYGTIVDTIIDKAAKAQYQFKTISVTAGEKYCIVYNAWSNDNADGVWNFSLATT